MWNESEKNEAIAEVDRAWDVINQVLSEYNFDESKSARKMNKALKHITDEMIAIPTPKPKSGRPMTTIRVDTHGMNATTVQDALDAYVQDAVDQNLQAKS